MDFRSNFKGEVARFLAQNDQNYQKMTLYYAHWSLKLLEAPKNFEGHINTKLYQNQLEHQKLYNLVTNFFKIGPSEAKIYKKM